jgi:hypothetical protein
MPDYETTNVVPVRCKPNIYPLSVVATTCVQISTRRKGWGELGADCARKISFPGSTTSREEKANRISSTSQTTNFLVLFLGKMMSMLTYEMASHPLGAAPRAITKRALRLDFMLVRCMPLKFLESSVFFIAIIMIAEPILGTSSTILDTSRASRCRDLPVICKS